MPSSFSHKQSQEDFIGEVTVTYDPTIIRHSKKSDAYVDRKIKEGREDGQYYDGMSKLEAIGQASSDARMSRMRDLKKLYDDGKIITVASAVTSTGLTRSTIISYCKDINLKLLDEKTGKSVLDE